MKLYKYPYLIILFIISTFFEVSGKDSFRLVLCVPANFSMAQLPKGLKSTSMASQDFIKGSIIAVDSLSKCGNEIELFILESSGLFNNEALLSDTLQKIQPQVVIGSIIADEMKLIDLVCGNMNIPLISPISLLTTCPKDSNYYQSNASLIDYGYKAAKIINQHYRDKRVILISEWKYSTEPVASAFYDSVSHDSLVVIDCNGKGSLNTKLLERFSPTENIIFIPTRSEVFCSGVLSQIQADSSEKSTVIALYPILNNKSIGFDLWKKFSIHFITPFFINYGEPLVNKFLRNYRKHFSEEPNEFSFRGYDEVLFAYKRFYLKDNNQFNGLHTNYIYKKSEDCLNKKINSNLQTIFYEDNKLNIK